MGKNQLLGVSTEVSKSQLFTIIIYYSYSAGFVFFSTELRVRKIVFHPARFEIFKTEKISD